MQKAWIMTVVTAAVVAVGGAASSPAGAAPATTAPETSMSFVSQSGDFVGAGRTARYLTPSATIAVSGTATKLTWSVDQGDDDWTITLTPGAGDSLHPGTYPRAERWPFQSGRAPGLDFSGDGRGCNTLTGSFVVNQIAFDRQGAVTMADVSSSSTARDRPLPYAPPPASTRCR